MELDGSKQGMLSLEEDRARGEIIFKDLAARRISWKCLELAERQWPLVLALMERLLRRALALRFTDPAKMVSLAEAACNLSEMLPVERYGQRLTNDLRARAWAEFGNALRVADELPKAGEALARARGLAACGTGSLALVARIADLTASFLTELRRFAEAADLLRSVAEAWYKRGRLEPFVKALVQMGRVHTQDYQPQLAIAVHAQALNYLRPGDPLFLPVLHTMALNFVEIGRADMADRMIRKFRGLYRRKGKLNEYRLFWLEGKIAFSLGNWRRAEGKLQTARLAFERKGKPFDAALVSLDLALIFAQQERRKELAWLIKQMLQTFQSLGIVRETIATLTLLRRSVEDRRPVEHLCGQIEALIRLMPELRPRPAMK